MWVAGVRSSKSRLCLLSCRDYRSHPQHFQTEFGILVVLKLADHTLARSWEEVLLVVGMYSAHMEPLIQRENESFKNVHCFKYG